MTTAKHRFAILLLVLAAFSASAGVARADSAAVSDATLVTVVAAPAGFSDGSDGFSDGSDSVVISAPDGFSDGADAGVVSSIFLAD